MRDSMLDIRPITSAVGAEIHGIDLAEPQPGSVWSQIREAFYEHGVIFFRDQELTPGQHVDFAGHFGKIAVEADSIKVAGYDLIEHIGKEPDQKSNIGNHWHTDQTVRREPTRASILYAREVPDYGGDTLWISMARVFDALSPGLRATLVTLSALHSSERNRRKSTASGSDNPYYKPGTAPKREESVHPVVIRLPENGRQVLYVNPVKTLRLDGWTEEESDAFLSHIYQFAQKPEFGCRFHWLPGSIACWDNYQTWHYATNDYPGERRSMHRITVAMPMFS